MNLNKRILKKEHIENSTAVIISAVITFFFLLKSPLHPWIGNETCIDSSVFKTIVLMMERGFMPYKDSFDHKGPLLYIINWFGNRISQYRGIWIIEFLFMTVSIFMIYKISRLLCKKSSSIVVTFTSISLLFGYFAGGNFTEEYAMTFISIALFIFLDYLKNNQISKIRLVICGACLGGTLLLRPNMISAWIVMSIAVLIKGIISHEWKQLGNFILWFVIGMMMVIMPIILWLAVNNDLIQCWKDYIIFNKEYTSAEGGLALFPSKWKSFFTFFNTTVYVLAFIALLFTCKIRDCFINVVYLIYMVITLVLICLSGMTYEHYGMILVPAVAYPLAIVFSEIEKIEIENISKIISILVSVYLLSIVVIPDWVELIITIPSIYEAKDDEHRSEVTRTIAEIVDGHVPEDEAISVYGNWDYIYIICNRKHATRYSYQFPVGQVMPTIMDEYMEQLQNELPKIIVIQAGRLDDNILSFLNKNNYQPIWSQNEAATDGAIVYLLT